MPLDTTSTYPTTHLRLDGRRWNDLRHLTAQISTQPSADGSSLFTLGNTTVVCTITGPRESRTAAADRTNATIETELTIAPFAQSDARSRTRTARVDKRVQELQSSISSAFQAHLFTHLYPRSSILISLTVLSLDGGVLGACLNAASLALVDAGVPMPSVLAAVSTGCILDVGGEGRPEPLVDLNAAEETELPFMTVGTVRGEVGSEDQVSVLLMETRVQAVEGGNGPLDVMMRVGLDGCASVRGRMEEVIRRHGKAVMAGRR